MIHRDPPEPAVGTILEVGCRPLPDRALSGDLLTFERLPGGWTERHNRSPHDRPVSWETVAWWHPWRAVDSGPSRVRGHRSVPRWRALLDEGRPPRSVPPRGPDKGRCGAAPVQLRPTNTVTWTRSQGAPTQASAQEAHLACASTS